MKNKETQVPPREADPADRTMSVFNHAGQTMRIFDLGEELSRELRKRMDANLLATGRPFRNGSAVSSSMLTGGVAAGSSVLAGLAGSRIFLASAAPEKLMQAAGGGVYSMVMNKATIATHAAFLPVGGAAIAAPILLFSAFSTIQTTREFARLRESMEALRGGLEELLKRDIAEDAARLLSAQHRLQDIWEALQHSQRFTDSMKLRLALTERDVNVLRHKYEMLAGRKIKRVEDGPQREADTDVFVVAALTDLGVDFLRLRLNLQDCPDSVEGASQRLNAKITHYEGLFRNLREARPWKDYAQHLQRKEDEATSRAEKRKLRKDLEQARKIVVDYTPRHKNIPADLGRYRPVPGHLSEGAAKTNGVIVFHGDAGSGGPKAHYTEDLEIQRVA